MTPLLPLLVIPLIASVGCALVRRGTAVLEALSVVAAGLQWGLASTAAITVARGGSVTLGNWFSLDALGAIVLWIVATIGFAAAVYAVGYVRTEVTKGIIGFHRVRQFYALMHLFLLAMFFAITTTVPILMWIGIEATTLSTAFLVSFYNKPSSIEAAWKYLILNSVGLFLGFLGTLLFFTSVPVSGGLGIVTWDMVRAAGPLLDLHIAQIAFILVIVGYGTKVGLAPMHAWLPDAHSKAPSPISAMLSGALLNVAFLAVLRFKAVADMAAGVHFSQNLLLLFGMLSLVFVAGIMFVQYSYKRLLAYSSIEHMGIMAIGFGFGGLGIFAALLHMIYHSLAKATLFFSAGNIFLRYSTTKIERISGLVTALPVTAVTLFMGFLAATGVPPFGTFLTELYIVSAGIGAHPFLSAVVLLALALIFVGFLRYIMTMSFGEVPEGVTPGEANRWTIIPPIALLALLLVLSVYLPDTVRALIDAASLSV